METGNLIRDTEAAKKLGCGRSTLWRWVENGTIPKPLKIGGMSRWYEGDIDAVIARAARKARGPKPEPRRRRRITHA